MDVLHLGKYYVDGDYVHVDDPQNVHVHVLGNHLLLGLIFFGYELRFDFVLILISLFLH